MTDIYKANNIDYLSNEYFYLFCDCDNDYQEAHWIRAGKVRHADRKSYRMLNHEWGVDDNLVFYQGKVIKGLNTVKTNNLNELYVSDGMSIFSGGQKLRAEAYSFEVMDNGFYIENHGRQRVIYCGYAKDSSKVFCAGEYGADEIEDADLLTFQVLQYGYAVDHLKAYYCGRVISGVNAKLMRILSPEYAIDDRYAYYQSLQMESKRLENVELNTFQVIQNDRLPERYAKDQNQVYYKYNQFVVADSLSFEFLDSFYYMAKDSMQIYIRDHACTLMDYDSFEYLGQGYSRDSSAIYFEDKIVAGVDSDSFTTQFDDTNGCSRYGHAQDCHTQYEYGVPTEQYYVEQQRTQSELSRRRNKERKQRYQSSFKEKLGGVIFIFFLPILFVRYILYLPFKNNKQTREQFVENAILMTRILSGNDSEIVGALELLLSDSKQYVQVYGDIKNSPGILMHEAWKEYKDKLGEPDTFIYIFNDLMAQRKLLLSKEEVSEDVIESYIEFKLGKDVVDFKFLEILIGYQEKTGKWLDGNDILKITDDIMKQQGYRLIDLFDGENSLYCELIKAKDFVTLHGLKIGRKFSLGKVFSTSNYYEEAKDFVLNEFQKQD